MLPNEHLLETHGIVLATAKVNGIEFFVHAPRPDGDHPGWVVGVDEEGVRHATLIDARPIHEGKGLQLLERIAAGEPTPVNVAWRILDGRLLSTEGELRPLLKTLSGPNRKVGRIPCPSPQAKETHQRTLAEIDAIQAAFDVSFGSQRARMAYLMHHGMKREIQDGSPRSWAPWPIRATNDQMQAAERVGKGGNYDYPIRHGSPGHFEGSPETIRLRLLENLGLTPATARRVADWKVPVEPAAVEILKSIPVDWVPTDPGEIDAFRSIAESLDIRIRKNGDLSVLLSGAKGRWIEFEERLAEAAGATREVLASSRWVLKRVLRDATFDAMDLVSEFSNAMPSIPPDRAVTEEALRLAWEALAGSRGLPALLEASRTWHARFVPVRANDPELEWEPALPAWKDDGTGFEVISLATGSELEAEGSPDAEGLDHCVGKGGYALKCSRGDSRIVSLRLDGKRVSTAEIDMASGNVVQHRARKNLRPPEEAEATLRHYLRLPETREAIARGVRPVDVMSTFDLEEFEAAIERWRPYLCGRWKHASAQDFLERLGFEREPAGMRP